MAKDRSRKMQPRISLGTKTLILFSLAVTLVLGSALGTAWWRMGKLIGDLTHKPARREALVARMMVGWPITDWDEANKTLATFWKGQNSEVTPPELISLERCKNDESLAGLAQKLRRPAAETKLKDFWPVPSPDGTRRYVLAIRAPAGSTSTSPTLEPGSLQGFVRVSFPEHGQWGNLLAVIWIGVMAGILAMLVFVLIAQRMFLHPLRQLRRTADKVTAGNIKVRSHIRTGDEFEDLSDTFNSMLARLADAREQLQAINRSLDVKLEEVSRANVALSEANKLKSEFIANVSHELRTPLNSIIGFAELLSEGAAEKDSERATKYADNILQSGRSLLEIINDLLDLARIEAGKVRLHIEKTSLKGICEDLIRLTAPLTDKKQLDVDAHIAEDIPLLQTDGGKLQQVLYNLLSNAIKFTPGGGQVRLEAEQATEGLVAISVMDNGPGISKEEQEHIFDKFTQVDTSATRKHGGAGLGLAIAKELAGLLGGEITVTSELGQGSAFTLTVPMVLTPPEVPREIIRE